MWKILQFPFFKNNHSQSNTVCPLPACNKEGYLLSVWKQWSLCRSLTCLLLSQRLSFTINKAYGWIFDMIQQVFPPLGWLHTLDIFHTPWQILYKSPRGGILRTAWRRYHSISEIYARLQPITINHISALIYKFSSLNVSLGWEPWWTLFR